MKKNLKKEEQEQIKERIEIRNKLIDYEIKKWQEERGKYVEFDIKTMNKYNKYYEEMKGINPDPNMEGIGVEQLEEPFISFGLAYNADEIQELIRSVDDDGSGRIEFAEFLRIIHNKSKIKTKGNKKITKFFKQLANDKLGDGKEYKYFGIGTIMGIMRRKNLLKAFNTSDPIEREEGEKVLNAYSEMLTKKKTK